MIASVSCHWRWPLLALLLALGACAYLPVRTPFLLTGGTPARAALDGRRIGVLAWNIHKEAAEPVWQREFAELVANRDIDLALLQEVPLHPGLDDYLTARGLGWSLVPNLYHGGSDVYVGVLTAARAGMRDPRAFHASTTEYLALPKAMLFSRHPVSTPAGIVELLLVNLHGINLTGDHPFQEQIAFVSELARQHRGPLVIGGDFNTWNADRDCYLRQRMAALGLAEVDFGARAGSIKRFLGGPPLDRLFYRADSLAVVPDSVDVIGGLASSDHAPLFVALRIIPSGSDP